MAHNILGTNNIYFIAATFLVLLFYLNLNFTVQKIYAIVSSYFQNRMR
jgi:hypothetical protein